MTRPLGDSDRFLSLITGDFASASFPVLSIVPKAHELQLDAEDALIFTSSHGIEAVDTDLRGRLVYCVGERTMQAARAAGCSAIYTAKDADDLVGHLAKHPCERPLMHVRGQHTSGNIVPRLVALGLPVREVIAYDQQANPCPEKFADNVAGHDVVIFPVFSARSARILSEWLKGVQFVGRFVAISEVVGNELLNLGCDPIVLARYPDAAAMAASVQEQLAQLRVVE